MNRNSDMTNFIDDHIPIELTNLGISLRDCNSTLQHLEMQNNEGSAAGAFSGFLRAIQDCKYLKHLDLSRSLCDDDGNDIAEVVRANSAGRNALGTFILNDNKLSKATIIMITGAVSDRGCLESVELVHRDMTSAAKDEVRQRMTRRQMKVVKL